MLVTMVKQIIPYVQILKIKGEKYVKVLQRLVKHAKTTTAHATTLSHAYQL